MCNSEKLKQPRWINQWHIYKNELKPVVSMWINLITHNIKSGKQIIEGYTWYYAISIKFINIQNSSMYCLELKGECNKSMNICRGMVNTNLRTREAQVMGGRGVGHRKFQMHFLNFLSWTMHTWVSIKLFSKLLVSLIYFTKYNEKNISSKNPRGVKSSR